MQCKSTACCLSLLLALAMASATEGGQPKARGDAARIRLEVADSSELELKAHWGPITESEFNFHERWDELRNLRPAHATATYSGIDFRALLPREPIAPGELWELNHDALLTFLRQLHPGARLTLHINNGDSRGGGYGCLRTYDNRWADIMFRVHAEFKLKDGVFTPGQFAGRMLLDRSDGKVVFFHLFLPSSPVNVDIGWRQTLEAKVGNKVNRAAVWTADAGSVSRLELIGGRKSDLSVVEGLPGKTTEEVSVVFARQLYRFKQIDWVDFEKAATVAQRTGKPLHVIALNGTLDDESC